MNWNVQKQIIAQTIDILKRCHADHSIEDSWGCGGCLKGITNAKGEVLKCDCGADELNDEIDDHIEELKLVFGDPESSERLGVIHA